MEGSAFKISILLCVYNVEKYLRECLNSLLNQTIKSFDLIIVDDASTDNTPNVIMEFDDKRIRFYRNKKNIGIAKCRNMCVKLSRSEYLFFSDGDCIVSNNWLEQGLKFLKDARYVGVEGKTYYVAKDYKPTKSDSVIENAKPGEFMTCNVAYKKSYIERAGSFDTQYFYHSDRDLALRLLKFGAIGFNPDMIVYHQKRTMKPAQFVRRGRKIRNKVILFKKYGEKNGILWRIVNPLNLLAILFPPSIFVSFFRNKYATKDDIVLFPFIYVQLLYERLNLWYMCAREKVFLI